MSAEQTVVFSLATLLQKLPAAEVAAKIEGHYGYLGIFLDWQIEPFFAQINWTITGLNFRHKSDECLMILKVVVDGVPSVVFVSGSTPRDCIVRMLKKLSRGDLVTYVDKYA